VLARQAGSIRKRESVASWLFGVACRASARIRMSEARRRRFESKGSSVRGGDHTAERDSSELWPELHCEIARLPEKYRIAIVLCYFEGLTHEQAADRLGWPVVTVKTRLGRARDQLRRRLERCGRSPVPGIPLAPWGSSHVADLPPLLLDSTRRAAVGFLSGAGGAECASARAIALALGVLKSMLIHKLRLAAIVLLGVMAAGLGVLVFAQQVPGGQQLGRQPAPVSVAEKDGSQPTVLRLFGTTDYDPSMVTIVQTPFNNCRVDEVLVDLGATVKRGDPLLKLFSTDLAAAKGEYELASSQWKHDKKIYDYKVPLARENTLPRKELIEVEENEAQSRLKMRIAKDKLLMYGLSEAEIAEVPHEDGVQKGKFILRSRADGVVVRKSVMKGIYYAAKDELMVITPLDRLFVRGNISEADADRVQVGQVVKVIFPFGPDVVAKIDYIDRTIDPQTRTVKFRTTIPNPEGRVKDGAFVNLDVELSPNAKSPSVPGALPQPKSSTDLEKRLSEVERKLERLLDQKGGQNPTTRILQRLDDLERKLDRILDLKDRW
jgi:RNA polymerase sigma factor (sigma-70 family)